MGIEDKAMRYANLERLRLEIMAGLRFGREFQCSEGDAWDVETPTCRHTKEYAATGDDGLLCERCRINTNVYQVVKYLKKRISLAKAALVRESRRQVEV